MRSTPVMQLASKLKARGIGEENVVSLYALVMGLQGLTVLDGTTQFERMRADLAGIEAVSEWIGTDGADEWENCLREFRTLIGEAA